MQDLPSSPEIGSLSPLKDFDLRFFEDASLTSNGIQHDTPNVAYVEVDIVLNIFVVIFSLFQVLLIRVSIA